MPPGRRCSAGGSCRSAGATCSPSRGEWHWAGLKLDGAELHVARNADGRLNLQALGGPAAPVPAPAASAAASAPQARAAGAAWQASLDQLEIDDARLSWNDASTRPAAALQIEALRVRAKQWQWPLAAPAPMTLSATLRNQAPGAAPAGQFSIDGNFSDREANGTLELSELALAELAPTWRRRCCLAWRAGPHSKAASTGAAMPPRRGWCWASTAPASMPCASSRAAAALPATNWRSSNSRWPTRVSIWSPGRSNSGA